MDGHFTVRRHCNGTTGQAFEIKKLELFTIQINIKCGIDKELRSKGFFYLFRENQSPRYHGTNDRPVTITRTFVIDSKLEGLLTTRGQLDASNRKQAVSPGLNHIGVGEAKGTVSPLTILTKGYALSLASDTYGKFDLGPLLFETVVAESTPAAVELIEGHPGTVVGDLELPSLLFRPCHPHFGRSRIIAIGHQLNDRDARICHDVAGVIP